MNPSRIEAGGPTAPTLWSGCSTPRDSFALAETHADMGPDPNALESVTVSVCMPAFAEAQDLRVIEAKDLRGRNCL